MNLTKGTGEGFDYTGSATNNTYCYTPWYYSRNNTIEVTMEEGITSIGNNMFYDCTGLTILNIPSTVTSIGENAFYNCSKWNSTISFANITEIKSSAFYGCVALQGIWDFSKNLTSIENSAFYNCELILGECDLSNITSIGNCVFQSCTGITKVILSDKIEKIGLQAFREDIGIKELTIPISLDAVISSGNVSNSNNTSFYNCTGITKVNFTKGTGTGFNYATDLNNYYAYTPWYYSRANTIEVTMEEGITSIGNNMFYDCTGLTILNIPSTVTSIGKYAFYNCAKWKGTLNLQNFTKIENGAFQNCSSLTGEVNLTNVTEVGEYSFYNCSGISKVIIGDNITSMGISAFRGDSGIKELTIPMSFNTIYDSSISDDYYARFYKCSNIEKLTFTKGNGTQVVYGTSSSGSNKRYDLTPWYYSRAKLKEVVLPSEGVTTISDYMFTDCTALTTLVLPDTITSIGTSAFYNCGSWQGKVNLADYEKIGSYAFYNCTNITGDFTLSDKITYIGNSTFYNCVGLTGKTSLTEKVTSIGSYTFYNCTGLTSINMPNTISQIGSYAFNNCIKLGAIVVPYQATIGEKAFYAVKEIHYDGKSSGSPWGASKVTKCNNVTFTTTKAVTCQTRGSGYYNCDVLGGRVNVTLIELNHTPNFVNDVCTICGYKRRWENTANGDSFKFTRNGATWTSNNRGVPLSTAMSTWEANLEEAEVYTLKYRVSSEQDKDILKITLDGETIVTASGNGSEVTIQLNLSEGKHTLVATYEKDSLNDSNNDNAYIVLYK